MLPMAVTIIPGYLGNPYMKNPMGTRPLLWQYLNRVLGSSLRVDVCERLPFLIQQ